MRIKRIKCDQFAGLNQVSIDFKDGMNVVVGENESGKSSLMDLASNVLFKTRKLDKRSDAGFIDSCFPKKAGGTSPSIISGSLEFQVGDKDYEVSKKWNSKEPDKGMCELVKSDVTLYDDEAEDELRSILQYGEATFKSTLLSSQRNASGITEFLFDPNNAEISTDLTNALSNASLEIDGLMSTAILKGISDNEGAYTKGWSLEEDKAAGNGEGRIKATNKQLKNIVSEIDTLEEDTKKYTDKRGEEQSLIEELKGIEDTIENVKKYQDLIDKKEDQQKALNELAEEVKKEKAAIKGWPTSEERLEKAKWCADKLKAADVLTDYEIYMRNKEAVEEELAKLNTMVAVDELDVDCLDKLSGEKKSAQNSLRGVNAVIDIKKLNPETVSFTYLNGEAVEAKENNPIQLESAIRIDVLDNLEMEIKPTAVDVDAVKETLKQIDEDYKAICQKYGANTLEAIKTLKRQYEEQKRKYDQANTEYENYLSKLGKSKETLDEERKMLGENPLKKDAVLVHLKDMGLDETTIVQEIADLKKTIDDYEKDYTDQEQLKITLEKDNKDMESLRKAIEEIEEKIPDDIEDKSLPELQIKERATKDTISEIQSQELPTLFGNIANREPLVVYSERLKEVTEELEKYKLEGKRWADIKAKFNETKERLSKVDITTLSENFKKYINGLTDGAITVDEFGENLGIALTSGSNTLTDRILSEGTRETINLAFRLAMIDDLFPEGGGFAVFDDSFVNMDQNRNQKACEVLKEFAKRNQVIFVTCHLEYVDLLDVEEKDVIRM